MALAASQRSPRRAGRRGLRERGDELARVAAAALLVGLLEVEERRLVAPERLVERGARAVEPGIGGVRDERAVDPPDGARVIAGGAVGVDQREEHVAVVRVEIEGAL